MLAIPRMDISTTENLPNFCWPPISMNNSAMLIILFTCELNDRELLCTLDLRTRALSVSHLFIDAPLGNGEVLNGQRQISRSPLQIAIVALDKSGQ